MSFDYNTPPYHASQRTWRKRRGCNLHVPWAGSLSLRRQALNASR